MQRGIPGWGKADLRDLCEGELGQSPGALSSWRYSLIGLQEWL